MINFIKNFFNWILKALNDEKDKKPIIEKPKEKDPMENEKPITRNEILLEEAWKEIGTLEVKGSGSNKVIENYYREISSTGKSNHRDDVPWCAAFLGTVLKRSRMGYLKDNLLARKYLKWGVSSKKNPLPGDLVIYWRGKKNGWQGHVGIYVGQTKHTIYTLGGNQNDQVNIKAYAKHKMLDFRRSSKIRKLDNEDKENLISLGELMVKEWNAEKKFNLT